MAKQMTAAELHKHITKAKDTVSDYLAFLEAGTEDQKRQANLLAYWLQDYVRLLKKESSFDPKKLIRYKRGSIVKVHLGYRIGSEEGGLHFGVVVDVDNRVSAQTATIIPLTSVKPGVDLATLHKSKIPLGDEVYMALQTKLSDTIQKNKNEMADLQKTVKEKLSEAPAQNTPEYVKWEQDHHSTMEDLLTRIKKLTEKVQQQQKMRSELDGMKAGSIALVGQITTVSKIRIYDPLYPSDVFANIRLSSASMDKLDQKIKELYTFQPKDANGANIS